MDLTLSKEGVDEQDKSADVADCEKSAVNDLGSQDHHDNVETAKDNTATSEAEEPVISSPDGLDTSEQEIDDEQDAAKEPEEDGDECAEELKDENQDESMLRPKRISRLSTNDKPPDDPKYSFLSDPERDGKAPDGRDGKNKSNSAAGGGSSKDNKKLGLEHKDQDAYEGGKKERGRFEKGQGQGGKRVSRIPSARRAGGSGRLPERDLRHKIEARRAYEDPAGDRRDPREPRDDRDRQGMGFNRNARHRSSYPAPHQRHRGLPQGPDEDGKWGHQKFFELYGGEPRFPRGGGRTRGARGGYSQQYQHQYRGPRDNNNGGGSGGGGGGGSSSNNSNNNHNNENNSNNNNNNYQQGDGGGSKGGHSNKHHHYHQHDSGGGVDKGDGNGQRKKNSDFSGGRNSGQQHHHYHYNNGENNHNNNGRQQHRNNCNNNGGGVDHKEGDEHGSYGQRVGSGRNSFRGRGSFRKSHGERATISSDAPSSSGRNSNKDYRNYNNNYYNSNNANRNDSKEKREPRPAEPRLDLLRGPNEAKQIVKHTATPGPQVPIVAAN